MAPPGSTFGKPGRPPKAKSLRLALRPDASWIAKQLKRLAEGRATLESEPGTLDPESGRVQVKALEVMARHLEAAPRQQPEPPAAEEESEDGELSREDVERLLSLPKEEAKA